MHKYIVHCSYYEIDTEKTELLKNRTCLANAIWNQTL